MDRLSIIFPHQLFKNSKLLDLENTIILIEEYLFFKHYNFHKQKLTFHRASMKSYEDYLLKKGKKVLYIDTHNELSDIRKLLVDLAKDNVTDLDLIDPTDNWLKKRLEETAQKNDLNLHWIQNPLFMNSLEELQPFFKKSKKKFYQTSFYKDQRRKRNILMKNGEPEGGQWTYDSENRKKYPKNKIPPVITFPQEDDTFSEARKYISNNFSENYGELNQIKYYPTSFKEADAWFEQFLELRFQEFGPYEDAIVQSQNILNHSVLSPLINVGLLHPEDIVLRAIFYAKKNNIPINSTEGFVRQIIGWREFIRGIYEVKGTEERTKNFWGHKRRIPSSFYDGTTGIIPIDMTIKKVLKTGYAHHIERLMILGNFMVLCEFDPDDVYQWFMELFIDAYDWVMVPNVYGMSMFADGGIMSSKPYISSSNYIRKMSDYENGDWQKTWDGLFWRFMDKHRTFFTSNPRLGMLIGTFDKMDKETQTNHIEAAENFLLDLDQ